MDYSIPSDVDWCQGRPSDIPLLMPIAARTTPDQQNRCGGEFGSFDRPIDSTMIFTGSQAQYYYFILSPRRSLALVQKIYFYF
jgi:hypothetical protein